MASLKGKTLFITGSTGFLGKSIVEKCLRDLPDVSRIELGIRSSARRSGTERLEREVLASPAFRPLREKLGDENFAALAAEKLAPIIARLPVDRPQPSDNLAISRLLVELLPEHRRPASPVRQQADAKAKKYLQAMIVLSCLALGAAALVSML